MDDKTKQLHDRMLALALEAQRMARLLNGLANEANAVARALALSDLTIPPRPAEALQARHTGLFEAMAQQLGMPQVADLSAADCVTVTPLGRECAP